MPKMPHSRFFCGCIRNLGHLRNQKNLAPWLYRVTVNLCRDMQRKSRVSREENLAADATSKLAGPEVEASDAERRRFLSEALLRLPERERAAVVLRDVEGLSTREVAEALGCTEATVRSHSSAARTKLRDMVERYLRRHQ